jgi:serine/threonine protein kinase
MGDSLNYRNNGYNISSFQKCEKLIKEINNNLLTKLIYNTKQLNTENINFTFLGKGGQGSAYLMKSNNECGSGVIKVSKFSNMSTKEINILQKCKELIESNHVANLLYYNGHLKLGNTYYIATEFADGTLEKWIEEVHTYDEWRSFMFQILHGIHIIQTKLKGFHNDLKPKNIFYKKIKDGYIRYDINGKSFHVRTFGFLFLIADFGHMQIVNEKFNKLNNDTIQSYIDNNMDFKELEALPRRIIVNSLENYMNIDELVKIIKSKNDEHFDSYYKSSYENIYGKMKQYPEHVKTKMLFRSVAYYIIEKNYINVSEIPLKYQKNKLPPIKIIKEINDVFTRKDSIVSIFNEFEEYTSNQIDGIIATIS